MGSGTRPTQKQLLKKKKKKTYISYNWRNSNSHEKESKHCYRFRKGADPDSLIFFSKPSIKKGRQNVLNTELKGLGKISNFKTLFNCRKRVLSVIVINIQDSDRGGRKVKVRDVLGTEFKSGTY